MSVATKERVTFHVSAARDDLLAVLMRVRGVIERRSTIPVLANVKLEAADGRLRLTATDLDMEMTDSIACEAEGATTVNAEQLSGLLAKMPPGGDCSLSLVGAEPRLVLRCGRSNYRLNVLPATDFPAISGDGLGEPISLDTGELETLIAKTAFAISKESVRYYYCGARLHMVGAPGRQTLRMVATNGHLLALAEIEAPANYTAEAVTVPDKTIREIGRLLQAAGETVSLRFGAQKVQVASGSWKLTSKVIDGHFPDYERVIPDRNPRLATFDRRALINALDRIRTIAPDTTRSVRMEVSEGHLRITLKTLEGTEGDEEIEADFKGSPLSVGFNAGYLIDVLARIEGERVEFHLAELARDSSTVADPALITDPSNSRVKYVQVPLRA